MARVGGPLLLALGFIVVVTAVIRPWAFHIGGRWTPFNSWHGVGRLIDSEGRQYGLFLDFSPEIRNRRRGASATISGDASMCTPSGLKIPFRIRGGVHNTWWTLDGKPIDLDFTERTDSKPKRHFSLYGAFQGPELTMDDHTTTSMYVLPDSNLSPAPSYTSAPEKHARVTLEWGTMADFERLCGGLPRS